MNPVCPICGKHLVLTTPPTWTPEASQWLMLLVIRHVLKDHPDWLAEE